MKTLIMILLCSLPLIGNGQMIPQPKEEPFFEQVVDPYKDIDPYWGYKGYYNLDIQIKSCAERLILMQQLVEQLEKVLEIKEQQLISIKLKYRIKEKIYNQLFEQYKECLRQDSIRLSHQFEIRYEYPLMIQEEPIKTR